MGIAFLIVVLLILVAMLLFRRQYARLLGVDPEASGVRRARYGAAYVVFPILGIVVVLILLAVELSKA